MFCFDVLVISKDLLVCIETWSSFYSWFEGVEVLFKRLEVVFIKVLKEVYQYSEPFDDKLPFKIMERFILDYLTQ